MLEKSGLPSEPLAPWRSPLARALHRNRSLVYARYVQMATITLEGRPANRTIVFRNFLANTNQLKFITDQRSEKIPQLDANPWAEICWYFPKTREQFRITGTIQVIKSDCTEPNLQRSRQAAWQDLSDAARAQFLCEEGVPEAKQPLPNFCLLLLEAMAVDHLELRGEPQNRTSYQRLTPTEWTTMRVNP